MEAATKNPEMKITAIAPWFGSKRTLAPKIIQELGPHRAYWEPFCGSMAVLLAKEASTFETVNGPSYATPPAPCSTGAGEEGREE